jgi:hypothetical protein
VLIHHFRTSLQIAISWIIVWNHHLKHENIIFFHVWASPAPCLSPRIDWATACTSAPNNLAIWLLLKSYSCWIARLASPQNPVCIACMYTQAARPTKWLVVRVSFSMHTYTHACTYHIVRVVKVTKHACLHSLLILMLELAPSPTTTPTLALITVRLLMHAARSLNWKQLPAPSKPLSLYLDLSTHTPLYNLKGKGSGNLCSLQCLGVYAKVATHPCTATCIHME